jgi:AAA+ ATPase superfamily predicted ATPase
MSFFSLSEAKKLGTNKMSTISFSSLHRSSFFATFQLLYCLVCRPSDWRNMVAHIDPALPPDFSLSELKMVHWQHSEFLRLLRLIYGAMPFIIGVIVWIWLLGITGDTIEVATRAFIYTITLSFIGALTGGITISVAFSFVASMISSLLIGLFFWIASEVGSKGEVEWYRVAIISSVFAVSLASSVLLTLAANSSQKAPIRKGSRFFKSLLAIGITIIALAFSGIILAACIKATTYLMSLFEIQPTNDLRMMGLAVGIGFAFGLYTHRWLWAIFITLVFGTIMTVLLTLSPDPNNSFLPYILLKSLIGGISNGFLFALLFALPYLLARYLTKNLGTAILAGLLGSVGVYVFLFMWRQPDSPIFLWSLIAVIIGFSLRGWLGYFIDNSLNNNKKKSLRHRVNTNMSQFLEKMVRGFTQFSKSENRSFETLVKNSKKAIFDAVESEEKEEEFENPYITGIPLKLQNKELFVGRTEIGARLELLLRGQSSPPILLHGQRRMGKTSLLIFLNELLPNNYVPLFIDFQGPVSSAKDYAGFLYGISRAMIRSAKNNRQLELPPLSRETLQDDPFIVFDEWLDSVEECVEGRYFLLTFDEFEALENVFEEGRLDRKLVLGMFRHIILHRSRFKILIAGAYRLHDFPEWADYFIDAESVRLTYLQEHEAIELIEKPVKNAFRFSPNATQRILTVTHCHPALIQLLCKEILFLLTQEQGFRLRKVIQIKDVEAAIPKALESGRNYFVHIAQISAAEKEILCQLAAQGEGATLSQAALVEKLGVQNQLDKSLSNLSQSDLIESTPMGYRFQVEFIRRWFLNRDV